MSAQRQKIIFWCIFCASVIYYFFANLVTLTPGQGWGADFAQYIIHAKNLISGQPYNNNFYAYHDSKGYPPGFPFLIAPLIKLFGVNFVALKIPNVIFWFLNALLVFNFSKKYFGRETALFLFVYLLTFPYFFLFKQNVLSDIPFVFLCTASMILFERFVSAKEEGGGYFIFSLFVMSLALATRSAGIVLFVSAALILFFVKKDYKRAMVVIFCYVLVVGVLEHFFHGAFRSYVNHETIAYSSAVSDSLRNLPKAVASFTYIFIPYIGLQLKEAIDAAMRFVGPLLFFLFSGLFVIRLLSGRISFLAVFCYLSFLLVALWPYDEGSRLYLPLICPVILGLIAWFCQLEGRWKNKLLSLRFLVNLLIFTGILYNVVTISKIFYHNDDILVVKENQELFNWVREHVGDNEKYMFFKPPVLALLTGKLGYIMPIEGFRDARLDLVKDEKLEAVKYYIFIKYVDMKLIEKAQNDPAYAKAWENSDFAIYTHQD